MRKLLQTFTLWWTHRLSVRHNRGLLTSLVQKGLHIFRRNGKKWRAEQSVSQEYEEDDDISHRHFRDSLTKEEMLKATDNTTLSSSTRYLNCYVVDNSICIHNLNITQVGQYPALRRSANLSFPKACCPNNLRTLKDPSLPRLFNIAKCAKVTTGQKQWGN